MREGWDKKMLGEIASVTYGFTGKAFINGTYRYVRITDIDKNGELTSEEKRYLEYSEETGKFILKNNDLLMARTGATFAKVLLYEDLEPSVFASYLIKIDFKENINNKLYWYFSKSENYWEQANSLSTGSAQPHFNGKALKNVVFTFPISIHEQKQIVAILDKAFAAIDQAKANIEKNIENAKEFQVSATNDLFNSISESQLLTVDDITDFITDYVSNGSFASLKENVNYKSEEDYAVLLRLTDHSKKFKNNFVYVDKHSFDFLKKSTVYPNDIILSNVGARLGTAFRAPDLGMPMTLGPNAMLIKAEKYGDYFFCWLQSAYGQKAIKSVVSGAGQPKFNKTQFKKIKVPIPKEESARNQLVNKINLAESEFNNLFKNYTKKLDSLEELKKSILQKAFAGELTEQWIMDDV